MPSPPGPPPPLEQRLVRLLEHAERLHRVITRLSGTLRTDEVTAIIVDDATQALEAHSGGLWLLDANAEKLHLVRERNFPEAMLATGRAFPLDPEVPVADVVLRQGPVWISSRAAHVDRYPQSAERMRALGLDEWSFAALPIVIDGRVRGVFSLTFQDERAFDEDERTYLTLLAQHCGIALDRARLYATAEAARERAIFLSQASAVLGSSLDYEQTLQNVARLAVPKIADWCGIELVGEDGVPRQVAVAHMDPAKVELAYELRRRYPPNPADTTGVPNVLRTGASEMYAEITDDILVAGARDEEHLRIARELGIRSVIIVAIRDRKRVFGALSFVLADDTDRRYTADDLVMAEQLGERVGAAISNSRLYGEAQAAIRARDDFLLVAGHELRTPVAAMSLHHETLAHAPDETSIASVRARGAKLRTQTDRMARLITELLDVSKVAAGRLVLERSDVDLGAEARAIAERMRDDFERAHAPLDLEIDEARGRWDRGRIDQIITNLLSNALKYGRGSPVHVRVKKQRDRAVLEVRDHGIGIAPEDQARIFERFERAVSTLHFGGLGLGLWITKQLVTAHGGTIAVNSEPGQGATFAVELPLPA
jgi:signal transduction histidine kinase